MRYAMIITLIYIDATYADICFMILRFSYAAAILRHYYISLSARYAMILRHAFAYRHYAISLLLRYTPLLRYYVAAYAIIARQLRVVTLHCFNITLIVSS